ncbi:hypothetical protein ABIC89_002445 [Variovorax boronicumulans]|uniref:hypothetical protein n=1 Tax=Variovorax boronicumulans TaxID=436515 RepID=UPI0033931404
MSVGLFVERSPGQTAISVDEWIEVLKTDPQLRHRREPYWATNPRTGARLSIAVGEADSEIHIDGEWEPFLRFQQGKLATEYTDELTIPVNLRRRKIVEVAARFGARIVTDVDDAPLDW